MKQHNARIEAMRAYIAALPARSAWGRGIKAYAADLLDELPEHLKYNNNALDNERMLEKAMLNGADDWTQYSDGGCAFVYDTDIAERICSPSELRRKDGGRLAPNSRETWMDLQARALLLAARIVCRAYRDTAE